MYLWDFVSHVSTNNKIAVFQAVIMFLYLRLPVLETSSCLYVKSGVEAFLLRGTLTLV